MEHFKLFLKNFLLIGVILQFGNIILSKTKFYDNYKKISGIIMAICLVSSLMSLSVSFKNINFDNKNINFNFEDSIKNEFQTKLKNIIENDLHNEYYVNLYIEIETNYKFLSIHIFGNIPKNREDDIIDYIKNKYCTPNDEVIIHSEDT